MSHDRLDLRESIVRMQAQRLTEGVEGHKPDCKCAFCHHVRKDHGHSKDKPEVKKLKDQAIQAVMQWRSKLKSMSFKDRGNPNSKAWKEVAKLQKLDDNLEDKLAKLIGTKKAEEFFDKHRLADLEDPQDDEDADDVLKRTQANIDKMFGDW